MSHSKPVELPLAFVEVLEEEYEALGGEIPAAERTWLLLPDDLIDAKGLMRRIYHANRNDPRSIDGLLCRRLNPAVRALIGDWMNNSELDPPTDLLLSALNTLIEHGAMPGAEEMATDESLWDQTAFESVTLSDWTCQLTTWNLVRGSDRRQRNRLLLHEAYPTCIRSRLGRHYARLHNDEPPKAALVLSGGGIRSATFGLGLMQGLARQQLLGEFDYLSTVSGGGYIGGWLTAWMHHHPCGLPGALHDLGEDPPAPLSPEPAPVRHLRSYSNYLAPRLGILTADTWSLIAIVVRNMLLNWLVLIPVFVSLLALPRLFVAAAHASAPGRPAIVALQLVALPVLVWAIGAVGWNLPAGRRATRSPTAAGGGETGAEAGPPPSVGTAPARHGMDARARMFARMQKAAKPVRVGAISEGWREGMVLTRCVLPFVLVALLLSLSWAWQMRTGAALHRWWTLGIVGVTGAVLAAVGLFGYCLQLVRLYGEEWPTHMPWSRGREQTPLTWRQAYGEFALSALTIFAGIAVVAAAFTFLLLPVRFAATQPGELNLALFVTVAPPVLLGLLILATAFFVGVSSRWLDEDAREWLGRLTAWLLIGSVAWLTMCILVLFGPTWLLSWHPIVKGVAATVGTVSGLFAFLAGRSGNSSGPGQAERTDPKAILLDHALQIASAVFVVALIVALALGTSMLLQALIADRFHSNVLQIGHARLPGQVWVHHAIVEHLPFWIAVLLVAAPFAVGFGISHFIDVNKFSMHSTYRARLVRAYLGASRPMRSPNWFTGFDDEDNLPMRSLWPAPGARKRANAAGRKKLLHVMNSTLNLVQGSNLAWQQRKAESFTVSALHCGNYHLGYRSSEVYGDRNGISLGTSMAISGAAASPNMGYHSSTLVSVVLCLVNARLGAWMGNPGVPGAKKVGKTPTTWSVGPLAREALGMTTDRDGYVYLSDGGHFENLGLYEMVLRRCHFVVLSDASGDPKYSFADLGNAVRKVRVDLGVPIEFDREIAIGRDGKSKYCGNYCAVGRIRYTYVDGERAKDGVLIYLKPAIIRGEPRDVLDYAHTSPTFPQESTADQFFSESQFEAYRALGQHVVERICSIPQRKHGLEGLVLQARAHECRQDEGYTVPASHDELVLDGAAATHSAAPTSVESPA